MTNHPLPQGCALSWSNEQRHVGVGQDEKGLGKLAHDLRECDTSKGDPTNADATRAHIDFNICKCHDVWIIAIILTVPPHACRFRECNKLQWGQILTDDSTSRRFGTLVSYFRAKFIISADSFWIINIWKEETKSWRIWDSSARNCHQADR